MFRKFAICIAALIASPLAAQTPSNVSLQTQVMVERTTTDAQGQAHTTLAEPSVVVPGDRLLFVLRYRNNGSTPAANFVVTNPLPAAVAFSGTDDARADVSVDGGHSWGKLAALQVRETDGTTRSARAEDVNSIRWAFAQPIPAGEAGQLTFRGVVR
jgi:uncharacterized repeat protein (TIGR01451 family)